MKQVPDNLGDGATDVAEDPGPTVGSVTAILDTVRSSGLDPIPVDETFEVSEGALTAAEARA